MEIKQFWQSKTLWTQLLAVLSLLIPGVNEWVSTNPVAATSVFAAVNTIVRFVTHGKISPFPVSTTNLLMVVGVTSMAFGLVFSQTSCTPTVAYQVDTRPYADQIETNPETVVVQPEHVTEVGGFQAEFGARLLTDAGEIDISDGGVSGDVVIDLRSGK